MTEYLKKAKLFESEEIGRVYLLTKMLSDWQSETGGTLEDFLEYLEKTFPKKKGVA